MAERISRRELALRGLAGAAAIAAPGLVKATQETQPPKEDPELAHRLAANEARLSKPLSEEARKIQKTALANIESASGARLKHILPENSEPCFMFVATRVGAKR